MRCLEVFQSFVYAIRGDVGSECWFLFVASSAFHGFPCWNEYIGIVFDCGCAVISDGVCVEVASLTFLYRGVIIDLVVVYHVCFLVVFTSDASYVCSVVVFPSNPLFILFLNLFCCKSIYV